MGMISSFPPELITLLTWLGIFIGASVFVLAVAVLTGPLIGGLMEGVFGWMR